MCIDRSVQKLIYQKIYDLIWNLVIPNANHCHPLQSTLFRWLLSCCFFFTLSRLCFFVRSIVRHRHRHIKRKLRTMFWINYNFLGSLYEKCAHLVTRPAHTPAHLSVSHSLMLSVLSVWSDSIQKPWICIVALYKSYQDLNHTSVCHSFFSLFFSVEFKRTSFSLFCLYFSFACSISFSIFDFNRIVRRMPCIFVVFMLNGMSSSKLKLLNKRIQ